MESGALTSDWLPSTLETMQTTLLERARTFRIQNTRSVDTYDDLKAALEDGGFFLMHWDGTSETEAKIQTETKATIRCIPFDDALETVNGTVDVREPGIDPVSGQPSAGRVVFARSY